MHVVWEDARELDHAEACAVRRQGAISSDRLCRAEGDPRGPRRTARSCCVADHALKPYEPSLVALFRSAVERTPDRLFIAERDASGAWAGLTYAQARRKVDAVAQALLDRGLSPERPVMALSGNAVEHAVLMLACYTAGIPIAPISVAYSLQSQDHAKLKYINELLTPGLVYVSDTGPFAKALAHITAPVLAGRNSANLAERDPVRRSREDACPVPRSRRRSPRSAPTPSRNSCSPPVRPACRRA